MRETPLAPEEALFRAKRNKKKGYTYQAGQIRRTHDGHNFLGLQQEVSMVGYNTTTIIPVCSSSP